MNAEDPPPCLEFSKWKIIHQKHAREEKVEGERDSGGRGEEGREQPYA